MAQMTPWAKMSWCLDFGWLRKTRTHKHTRFMFYKYRLSEENVDSWRHIALSKCILIYLRISSIHAERKYRRTSGHTDIDVFRKHFEFFGYFPLSNRTLIPWYWYYMYIGWNLYFFIASPTLYFYIYISMSIYLKHTHSRTRVFRKT